jgi:hypothetical protein
MKRLQILYYLSHVNLWELLVYLMPVISIFCIAVVQIKIFNYGKTVSSARKTRKVYWALRYFFIVNLLMLLAICLRYFDLHEPPEKSLIFKRSKSFDEAMF